MLVRWKFKIEGLVNGILDQMDQDTLIHGLVVDPNVGGGQFLKEIEKRKRAAGLSDEEIAATTFGFADHEAQRRYSINKWKLKSTIKVGSFLEENFGDMRFNFVIGNPPFGQASENAGVSGTIGNKTLYRHFVKKAFEISDVVALVCQKGVYKYFDRLGYQIDTVNFMTEIDYWKYDTLYFIGRSIPKESEYIIEDKIVDKMFGINGFGCLWQSDSLMQSVRKGTVIEGEGNVIIRLPGNKPMQYGYVSSEAKVAKGPKFCFTQMESRTSWTVTDEDVYASCIGYYPAASIKEAEKMKLFVQNNKGFRYFAKKMKCKGFVGDGLSRLKKFDLSQIETGFEYPIEWDLTAAEIALIEAE